jgi:hypothetical protein
MAVRSLGLLGALALAAVVASLSGAAAAPSPSTSTAWVPVGGDVDALTSANGKIYLGGGFRRLAPPFGGFAVYRHGATTPEAGVVRFRDGGGVGVIADDGEGGWIVGGGFSSFGGVPCHNLAHVLSSGKVDPSWCQSVHIPSLLVRQGRTLYAALQTCDGCSAGMTLTKFDATTGRRLRWQVPLGISGSIYPPNVWSLAATPDRVFLGGGFASVEGHPAQRLAAVDAASGRFLWGADVVNGPVLDVVVHGDTVFAFGSFEYVDKQLRRGFAAFDARTGRLLDWHPHIPRFADVTACVAAGRILYVAFHGYRGLHQVHDGKATLIALDADSGAVLWKRTDGSVPLALLDGDLLLQGSQLFSVDPANGVRRGWHLSVSPWLGGSIGETPFAVSGSRLAFGGLFYTVEPGVRREGLAAVDAATGRPTAWAPHIDLGPYDEVKSLGAEGNTLYATGDFTSAGGQPRDGLAAFDLRTGALLAWHPRVGCGGACTDEIAAATPDAVYVSGELIVGGRNRVIAAFDPVSGAPLPWDPRPDQYSFVGGTAVTGSTVYLGGGFKELGGVPRPYLAAVDATTGVPNDWQPQPDGSVRALALVGATLYVAGDFEHMGSARRHYLAAFDTSTGRLLPWRPGRYIKGDRGVSTLTTVGSTVFVDGTPFDGVTGRPEDWPGGLPSAVTVAGTGSLVYATTGFGRNDWGGLVAVPPPR